MFTSSLFPRPLYMCRWYTPVINYFNYLRKSKHCCNKAVGTPNLLLEASATSIRADRGRTEEGDVRVVKLLASIMKPPLTTVTKDTACGAVASTSTTGPKRSPPRHSYFAFRTHDCQSDIHSTTKLLH